MRVADYLGCGQSEAVTLSVLEARTGLPGRVIRYAIQRERLSGELILSDNKSGYFLPASSDEVRRFARSMMHRAGECARIAALAESALSESGGVSDAGA